MKQNVGAFVLPTHKPAPPIGRPRPLSDVAIRKDYQSKVIPRKYEAQRIQADREAARFGYFYDRESFLRANRWTGRHNEGNDVDFRKFLFVTERNDKGVPVGFMSYEKIAKLFESKVLAKLGDRTDNKYVLKYLPQIEEAQLSKISSKSKFIPYYKSKLHERVDEVVREDGPLTLNLTALAQAAQYLKDMVGKAVVPLASIDLVWNTLPQEDDEGDINSPSLDSSTNSGPPYFLRKWRDMTGEDRVRTRVGREILRDSKYYANYLQKGVPVPWRSMMAHRLTTGGKDGTKERPVIAIEKANAISGKRVTYYLLDHLKKLVVTSPAGRKYRPFIALTDMPLLDKEMQMLLKVQSEDGDVINSSDVSAFDASANSNLIILAGEVIGYWIKGGQKYCRALAESMAVHTSVLTPLGFKYPARGGVKSGDGLTNLIDTVVSLLVFWYGHFNGDYHLDMAYAQGDDGIQVGPDITPEAISMTYAACGFDANVDKQWEAPGTVQFLQKLWVVGHEGGIVSVARTLISALTYERLKVKGEDWSPEAQTVAIISTVDNAAFNPLFKDLVNFIAEADSFQLHKSVSPASKILLRSGEAGLQVLKESKRETVNRSVSDKDRNGFDESPTNGVLRGKIELNPGDHESWLRVYGKIRIKRIERMFGINLSNTV